MNLISPDVIEVLISNANKPRSISNYRYPLNDLDDRIFEVLTYSIFKEKLIHDSSLKATYDSITLMQGVGEKGIDCFLAKDYKITAVIQCKKYKSNLSDKIILSEIIKFCLHFISNAHDFVVAKEFIYKIATTTGFTGKANLLPNYLKNSEIEDHYDIKAMTTQIIDKYREFDSVNYDDIRSILLKTIKSFSYQFIRPEDYDLWINDYPVIVDSFFDIKKVTDNTLVEKKGNEVIQRISDLFLNNELDNITNFVETYKKIASEKLNSVNFIGFDIQKYRQRPDNIRLTDLFVQPSFKSIPNIKNEKKFSFEKDLKITNIFNTEKNVILLGDPGAGKSLLVKFIIVNLIQNNSAKIGLKQFATFLPIRIELRKYNEVSERKSIIQYLVDLFDKDYQSRISILQLEKIFDNTSTIVFFDGLDEIFNTSHKSKIKENIEAFIIRFPKSKCIVTSRFIGYHDIKFNTEKFEEYAISRFDENQIKELVVKFYSTQHISKDKVSMLIENCLSQIKDNLDTELKTNPLILTLILILASNNIVIPDSKLEIYESCTRTLVDSLDLKEKGYIIELPIKNKNLTFSKLAYWQYESLSKNLEVSYTKAINILADFLHVRGESTDIIDAESKAEKFLEYAEKRSIYFEDNFTHKTFLEYYTSEYLYSTCIAKANDEGRKRLISITQKYLSSSFWYIVFELLFTRIDRVQPDNELLDEIFSKQIESNSLDVFYFFIGNLNKFNNISDKIKKAIITKTIMLCIKGEKRKNLSKNLYFEENSIIHKLYLLKNDKDLFNILQNIILELENDGLSEKEQIELYNIYYEIVNTGSSREIPDLLVKDIIKLKLLANKDLLLYSNYYIGTARFQKIDIQILLNQVDNFGHKSLFAYIPYRHNEFRRKLDTFDFYLLAAIETYPTDEFERDLKTLIDYGVKFEDIIQHVKTVRIIFYTRSQTLFKILGHYIKSNSKFIDVLLETIIFKNKEMKSAYIKFRSENYHAKLKNIDKFFDV